MKKLAFIVLVLMIILIGSVIFLSNYCRKLNKTEQNNIEQIIEGGEKQALILYQDSMTQLVKEHVDCITKVLQEANYTVTINHPISDRNYQAQDYDVVVLASPVYARKIAQPILNFADNQDFSGVKVLGVIVGMIKQDGQEEAFLSHINQASQVQVIKVMGSEKSQTKQPLEGLLSN